MSTQSCPCGYHGDTRRQCRCSGPQIQKYHNRISGPLLDRIDLHIEVAAMGYDELSSLEPGESSSVIRERVVQARQIQLSRFSGLPNVHCNAQMGTKQLQRYCRLDDGGDAEIRHAIADLNFSARAYDRILKVSRTIADLAGSEAVKQEHVYEAIQYRSLDRKYWE